MLKHSILLFSAFLLAAANASPAPNRPQILFPPPVHASPSAPSSRAASGGEVADPSHLIFASFAGLMQQWPNTLYSNGHSFILGSIPTGTLVYHARKDDNLPPAIEWLALDSEMSYGIMTGWDDHTSLLTYSTSRPMRVLVLDGMSAALSDSGWLDSQSVLIYGNVTEEKSDKAGHGFGWVWQEYGRAQALCGLGDEWGFDGIVRMNAGFEVLYCDFGGSGLDLVSQIDISDPFNTNSSLRPPPSTSDPSLARTSNLLSFKDGPDPNAPGGPGHTTPGSGHRKGNHTKEGDDRLPPGPPRVPSPFEGGSTFEWLRSASWHSPTRADGRVQLDPSTFVSFYERGVRSLAERRVRNGTENRRREQRLLGITNEEGAMMKAKLKSIVIDKNARGWDERPKSGVDWRTLVATIIDRYEGRLDELDSLTGNSSRDLAGMNATTRAMAVRAATYGTLFAYIDMSHYSNSSLTWLDSAQGRCESAFTCHMRSTTLTPSELLLKTSTEAVLSRICSTTLSILTEVLSLNLPVTVQTGSPHLEALATARLRVWHARIVELKEWLGWGVLGLKCDRVCEWGEVCSMPLWPLNQRGWWDGTGGEGEEVRPACVSRRTASLRR